MMITLLLGFCLMASAPGSGQEPAGGNTSASEPQPQATSKPSDLAAPRPGQFYDQALDLHFNYPVEMKSLNGPAEMEQGHLNLYGVSGDNDPEHQEAKRCVRFLLDAELPSAKAPQRDANMDGIWVDDSKQYKESRKPQPIVAQIVLVEFVRDCLPKELRNHENDVLGSMAMGFVSALGLQRMPNPLWYKIGKQKIHMNSAVGRPIVNGHLASAPIIVMSMATQWRKHLLAWVFISNDTETFNEITKSLVEFGHNGWGPMFAANLGPKGSGTPMTVLPK